jgi:hypothetical protein
MADRARAVARHFPLDFQCDQSVTGVKEMEKVRHTSRDRATDLMKHALFDAIERAHALAVRNPPTDTATQTRRLKAISQAGAEISALAAAMQIVGRSATQKK